MAAIFVLSAMNGIAHWYRPGGPLGPDELAGQYADLFLGGLKPSPPENGGLRKPQPAHEGAP
jgi:hypothetical protein